MLNEDFPSELCFTSIDVSGQSEEVFSHHDLDVSKTHRHTQQRTPTITFHDRLPPDMNKVASSCTTSKYLVHCSMNAVTFMSVLPSWTSKLKKKPVPNDSKEKIPGMKLRVHMTPEDMKAIIYDTIIHYRRLLIINCYVSFCDR